MPAAPITWSILLLLVASNTPALAEVPDLLTARKGHTTTLVRQAQEPDTKPQVDPDVYREIRYKGPVGELRGWLGQAPNGVADRKHPAMIWIGGGWPAGGMSDRVNDDPDIGNDQSARAYRKAGMVLFFPTVRGANGNPGAQELYYGEVDDVLAGIAHLKTIPYVDPKQIWLGGHSAGATLALLVAAARPDVRGVIALGPASIEEMMARHLPFDPKDTREVQLRDPIRYLDAITAPTIVIEGVEAGLETFIRFKDATKNPKIQFRPVPYTDHFTVVSPINALLAKRIMALGADDTLRFDIDEVSPFGRKQQMAVRRMNDLGHMTSAAERGVPFETPQPIGFFVYSWNVPKPLFDLAEAARAQGFEPVPQPPLQKGGDTRFGVVLKRNIRLADHAAVFKTSQAVRVLTEEHQVGYGGWYVSGPLDDY